MCPEIHPVDLLAIALVATVTLAAAFLPGDVLRGVNLLVVQIKEIVSVVEIE
jgi:hypothetical protein